ncbi:hypothetical protein AYI69_g2587 [Smittium culicis]|uniref:Uncharacterized protein n=1 Tax=Smittium culicis TaxID=133412 RepID=A0A1R1YMJ2_9FUNG|nr:hypothetical protein AYI69_g2587 [Smittium culicis]
MEPSARGNEKRKSTEGKSSVEMNTNNTKPTVIPKVFPGSAGAPIFSGDDIIGFLVYYELATSQNSVSETSILFPYYCTQDVRSKITKTNPYSDNDWIGFKQLLMDFYLKKDTEASVDDELNSLARQGTRICDITVYLRQFEYLIKKKENFYTISEREKKELLIKSIHHHDMEAIRSYLYDDEGNLLDYNKISTKFKTLSKMQESLNTETKFTHNNNMRCIYCDGNHRRINCEYFTKDKDEGLVFIGKDGFLENKSGEKIPTNWGKGGMRVLINKNVSSRQIKIENFDDCNYALEWARLDEDEVIEKDQFSRIVDTFASKRIKDHDTSELIPVKKTKTLSNTDQDDIPLKDRLNTNSKPNGVENFEKYFNPGYKFVSKIVNSESEASVTNILKNTHLSLSHEELFSISPSMRRKFNEELNPRKEINVKNAVLNDSEINCNLNINDKTSSNWKDFYLSSGSGKVKGYINGTGVEFLLDEGLEINIMHIDVYNALKSLKRIKIDTDINWTMRDANLGISKLIGVCKNCIILIAETDVSVPVFVSQSTEPQVILGRPWERKARVLKDNRGWISLLYDSRFRIW